MDYGDKLPPSPQVRVASGCLNLSVTEELADHRLTFAEGKGLGRKAVSEVVNSPCSSLARPRMRRHGC